MTPNLLPPRSPSNLEIQSFSSFIIGFNAQFGKRHSNTSAAAMKSAFVPSHAFSVLHATTSSIPTFVGLTQRRTFVSNHRPLTQFPCRKHVTKSSLQLWAFNIPMERLSVAQEVGQDMTRKIFAGSLGIIALTFVMVALYGLAARQNYDAVSFHTLLTECIVHS